MLWVEPDQNTVRPWRLYEILRKSEAYFKLCCGQNRIRIRSARGSYIQCSLQGNLSRAAPPMGNRNRTIELSTVPVRAVGGGGGIIPFGSASTTLYLLCSPGHVGYIKLPQNQDQAMALATFFASKAMGKSRSDLQGP